MAMTEPPVDKPLSDQAFAVSVRHEGAAVVVTVTGEVDTTTSPQLRAVVRDCLTQVDGGPVVVDLTAVSFFGSAGLAVLIDAASQAERPREALRVVVDHNRPAIRPIQVTGLSAFLKLYGSLEEALLGDGD
jgi:anti-sigma B factor antagonist